MTTPRLEGETILLVGSESGSLPALRHLLESGGFTHFPALEDASKLIPTMVRNPPAIVITELEMPALDGFRVLEMVQQMAEPGEILPVLIVAENAAAESRRRAFEAGAADFLVLPGDGAELPARVRNLLGMRARQQAVRAQLQGLERVIEEQNARLESAPARGRGTPRAMREGEQRSAFSQATGEVVHDFTNSLLTISGCVSRLMREAELRDDREETRKLLRQLGAAAGDATRMLERLRTIHRSLQSA